MAEFHLNRRERQRKRQGSKPQSTPMSGNRRSSRGGGDRGPRPDEVVLAEETGKEGIATVRLSAVRDPARQAQKEQQKRQRALRQAQAEGQGQVASPHDPRAMHAIPGHGQPPLPPPSAHPPPQAPPGARAPVQAPLPPAAPPGTTAPVRASPAPRQPVGPPEIPKEVPPSAQIAVIPMRLVAIEADGRRRDGELNATALTHGHVFLPAGQDAHGQRLYQLRPESAVKADEYVAVTVQNDGPRAKVAAFVFSGDRMYAQEVELGQGVQYTFRVQGVIDGHVELGYAVVQR